VVNFYRTYLPGFSLPGIRFVNGDGALREAQQWPEIEVRRTSGRVWFIFSHVHEESIGNEQDLLVNQLYQRGKPLLSQKFRGATLYLFDLPSTE
jgi:hypothetical protein